MKNRAEALIKQRPNSTKVDIFVNPSIGGLADGTCTNRGDLQEMTVWVFVRLYRTATW